MQVGLILDFKMAFSIVSLRLMLMRKLLSPPLHYGKRTQLTQNVKLTVPGTCLVQIISLYKSLGGYKQTLREL